MKSDSLNTKRQAIHLKKQVRESMHRLEKKKHEPHPQGAISRSNTKRPVLYAA